MAVEVRTAKQQVDLGLPYFQRTMGSPVYPYQEQGTDTPEGDEKMALNREDPLIDNTK